MKKSVVAILGVSIALVLVAVAAHMVLPEPRTINNPRPEAERIALYPVAALCVTSLAGCLLGMLSIGKATASHMKTSRSAAKKSVVLILGAASLVTLALVEGFLVLLLREFMKFL